MSFPLDLRSTEDHGNYLQNEAVVNSCSLYSPLMHYATAKERRDRDTLEGLKTMINDASLCSGR